MARVRDSEPCPGDAAYERGRELEIRKTPAKQAQRLEEEAEGSSSELGSHEAGSSGLERVLAEKQRELELVKARHDALVSPNFLLSASMIWTSILTAAPLHPLSSTFFTSVSRFEN